MQILRQVVIGSQVPSPQAIWIHNGVPKYFNNGQWEVIGNKTVLPTWDNLKGKPEFATVATSGDYKDLSNPPVIPAPYKLPKATTATIGGVKMGKKVNDLKEDDTLDILVKSINALIENLRDSGAIER